MSLAVNVPFTGSERDDDGRCVEGILIGQRGNGHECDYLRCRLKRGWQKVQFAHWKKLQSRFTFDAVESASDKVKAIGLLVVSSSIV